MTLDEFRNGQFQLFTKPPFGDGAKLDALVARQEGRIVVLDLVGSALSGPESDGFRLLTTQLIERGERAIVVNLEAATEVDSAGLGELIRAYTLIVRSGGAMPLVNAPAHFRQLVASAKFL